jgi:hypothetical protein
MNTNGKSFGKSPRLHPAAVMLTLILVITLAVLAPGSATAQTTATPNISITPVTCAQIVPSVQKNLSERCSALDRDQVCYGNSRLSVEYQNGANPQPFAQPGDIVPLSAIKSITMSPLNLERAEWGLAVLKARASVPGTTAGQVVTFVLYGDTNISTTPPATGGAAPQTQVQCSGTTTRATYIRSTPTANGPQLLLLQGNTTVNIIGRRANNSWVLVEHQNVTGWVFTGVLTLSCNLDAVVVVEPDGGGVMPQLPAFYFTTGVGAQAECQDIPSAGLLIQSPSGMKVSFRVNGADVWIGSSVVLQAQPNGSMSLGVLQGEAGVRVGDRTTIARTGQSLTVPLGGSGGLLATAPAPNPQPVDPNPLRVGTICAIARSAGLDVPCSVQVVPPTFTRMPVTRVPPRATFTFTPARQGGSPTPTQPVARTCTFTLQRFAADANPAPFDQARNAYCTTLRWDVEGVESVYLNGQGVVGHGSRAVCIRQTTSYTLTLNCGGQSKSFSYTLRPAGSAPPGRRPTFTPTRPSITIK